MQRIVVIAFCIIALTACTNDKPVPETSKVHIVKLKEAKLSNQEIFQVSAMRKSTKRHLQVQQQVINNDVYVECIISNFNMSDEERDYGDGFIELSVDGRVVDQFSTAAFIIKGLNKGVHNIKLELKGTNGQSYQLTKEFDVTIK